MPIFERSNDDFIILVMTKLRSQICDPNFVITLDYDCFSQT